MPKDEWGNIVSDDEYSEIGSEHGKDEFDNIK